MCVCMCVLLGVCSLEQCVSMVGSEVSAAQYIIVFPGRRGPDDDDECSIRSEFRLQHHSLSPVATRSSAATNISTTFIQLRTRFKHL